MLKKMLLCATLALVILLQGCGPQTAGSEPTEDFTVWLNMNQEFDVPDSLPDGEGQRVKVILLLGQSNATGCSLTSYLQKGVTPEQYETYEKGFPSVLINFCLDDHRATSNGRFVPVDLGCGSQEGSFGPEVGMAEVLSKAYPDEQVFLLKFSMSGYSLHHHWLCDGERGSIYEAFLEFAKTYMDYLLSKNYDARIGAICWMQGESDTTEFKASRYLSNQTALVSYLRSDLSAYGEEGGIYFIDAGISDSPYCQPAYPAINEAKEQFAAGSAMNYYFSTIDRGFTVHQEPEGDPDWGHYDALSELELGRLFGQYVIRSYEQREGI